MDEVKNDILPAMYLVMGGRGRKWITVDPNEYSDESNKLFREFLCHLEVFMIDNGITSIKGVDTEMDNELIGEDVLVFIDQAANRFGMSLYDEGFDWHDLTQILIFMEDVLRLTQGWDYIDRIVYLPEQEVKEERTEEND